jgi:hypothetical protein
MVRGPISLIHQFAVRDAAVGHEAGCSVSQSSQLLSQLLSQLRIPAKEAAELSFFLSGFFDLSLPTD